MQKGGKEEKVFVLFCFFCSFLVCKNLLFAQGSNSQGKSNMNVFFFFF